MLDEINSMQDGGIVKESINFGPEYKKFEDNTGRYERVVLPKQDTIWRINDYGADKSVYTTTNGYDGRFEDVYGGYRQLTPEEINAVKRDVEFRIKNIPHKKYLIEKYGEEMLMPENWIKLKK